MDVISEKNLNLSLSLNQYYTEIGIRRYQRRSKMYKKENKTFKEACELMSACSTKKVTSDGILEASIKRFQLLPVLKSYYGSINEARRKFEINKAKQTFYDNVVRKLVPNKDAIVVLGSAKFAVNRPGLSSTPVAKIMKKIAEQRRVVLVSETCTTIRCFSCKDKKCCNIGMPCQSEKLASQNRKIHGLKQCTHCRKFWNRDFSAACNIMMAFFGYYFNNKRPKYLRVLSKHEKAKAQKAKAGLDSLLNQRGSKSAISTQNSSSDSSQSDSV